ncbi:MAG: hypothetical protein A2W80_10535 [Candidatus Riflebacteria bacterium GWC2_50_8]|nr:MAG: hypothetical protein A2W80_10535 [Candidatus Riflebacteria bacterium GWC2_50_8]
MSVIDNITEWLLSAGRAGTLEIGSSYLRWVYGEKNQLTPALQIFRSCQTDAVRFTNFQSSYLFDSNKVAESLQPLIEIKHGVEKYANVVLPDQAFHFGSINIPAAAAKASLIPLLERDIQKTAPLPCNAYVIKHETGRNRGSQLNVQYCALPLSVLEDVQRACDKAHLIPVSIQPSFTGLFRLLSLHQNISDHPSVFLHIGNECTTMGVYEKSGLRAINLLDFGVQNFIQAVAQELNCDHNAAVQTVFHEPLLLDDPGASEAQVEIAAFGVVEPLLADFLQKIYGQLLLFSSEHHEESGYSRIVISGGGALIINLDRLITFNLGIPTSTISRELKQLTELPGLPVHEKLETLAPALGNIILQPARRNRFDRMLAA